MSSKKISQLPLYSGDPAGTYLVMNNAGETGSFKVLRETIIGASGSAGTSGLSGSAGTSGTSGSTGTSGTSGSAGTSGTSGTSGSAGTSGSSGSAGSSGSSGSAGTSGLLSLTGTTDNGVITLNGSAPNATVESNLTFDGSTLGVTGNVSASGQVSGATGSFTAVTVNGNLGVTGGASVGGDLSVSGGTFTSRGSWTLATGANTVSFTVTTGQSYVMWVNGNIPNGIVNWNATVTLSNSNVPVVGVQYGWYYLAGNALALTSIPSQIVGTAGTISTSAPAVSNSNTFTFGITNNSGTSQLVYYGYLRIS